VSRIDSNFFAEVLQSGGGGPRRLRRQRAPGAGGPGHHQAEPLLVRRVRAAVRHLQQPVAAQADPQEPGLAVGEEVHDVRQGLRQHARLGDAPAHAQAGPQLRRLRQAVLQAVAAAGPPPLAHRGEAVRVRPLRQGLRRQVQPAGPHADALRRQELQLPPVPQDVRAQVIPEQASRDGVPRLGRQGQAAQGGRRPHRARRDADHHRRLDTRLDSDAADFCF
jgi:hypothetical protein